MLRAGEHRRGMLHLFQITAQPRPNAGWSRGIQVGFSHHNVHGQRQEDRSSRRCGSNLDGAPQGAGQILDALYLIGPFGHRLHHTHQVTPQDGLGKGVAAVLLSGGKQEGRTGLGGVVQHAHSIAQPWRHMQVHHPQCPRSQRIAIRHGHCYPFLERQHILHVWVVNQNIHEGQLGRARVPNNMGHTRRP
jgi:hypothetical protein